MLFIIKTVFKKLLIVTAGVLVFFTALSSYGDAAAEKGVVASALLNVRSEPDKDSPSLGILTKNTIVTIEQHHGVWLKIEFKGKDGYIRNRPKYVRLYQEKTKKKKKREVLVQEPAPTGVDREIEQRTKEITEIDQEIKKHRKEVRKFSEKEKVIINGLNDIDKTLNRSRQKLSGIKNELNRIEAEIKNNNNALNDLKTVIKNNEQYIERRLVAMYKLHQVGTMNILASAESIYDLLGRRHSMELILEADAKILDTHIDNISRLSGLLNRLSEQKVSKEALKNDYKTQIKITEQNRLKRQALLSDIRAQKSLRLAAIESLEDAARELNQTVEALDQGFGRDGLEPSQYSVAFISRKGRLKMPVKGEIISMFGKAMDRQFHVETFHSGIKVKADRGEPVQAVSAGEVLFADWLKGYGNLIIINHGNHYYSLYGHTEELFKQKGDIVDDREVIATVGDTGSFVGSGLHFEIRHKGQPVDPLVWLGKQ